MVMPRRDQGRSSASSWLGRHWLGVPKARCSPSLGLLREVAAILSETRLQLDHVAERNALWALEAELERKLVAPFRPNKPSFFWLLGCAWKRRAAVVNHAPAW